MHTFFLSLMAAAAIISHGELLANGNFENEENHSYGWRVRNGKYEISNVSPFHETTPVYLKLHSNGSATIANHGEDGISAKAGEVFLFSCYCKSQTRGKMIILFIGDNGTVIGGKTTRMKSNGEWNEITGKFQAKEACRKGSLEIVFPEGDYLIDEVSLISQNTLK